MCKLTISTAKTTATLQISIEQDALNCVWQAILAAIPYALDAYLKCISPPEPPEGEYKPGNRPRCQ